MEVFDPGAPVCIAAASARAFAKLNWLRLFSRCPNGKTGNPVTPCCDLLGEFGRLGDPEAAFSPFLTSIIGEFGLDFPADDARLGDPLSNFLSDCFADPGRSGDPFLDPASFPYFPSAMAW